MANEETGISGFWIFLIGIFIVLPIIDKFTEDKNVKSTLTKTKIIKVVSGKNKVLEVRGNSATSPSNVMVKIPISIDTAIVYKTYSDSENPNPKHEPIEIKSQYAITSFDKEGTWEIDMKDKNGILVDWVKVTVY